MRKTLLIAAAALAASVISSQAQVYSQNIVGYVNIPAPAGAELNICNPLDCGNSLTNIITNPGGVFDGSLVNMWTGTGFQIFTLDSSLSTGVSDVNDVVAVTPPTIKPGQAFLFLSAVSSSNTITVVGTVHTDAAATGVQVIGTSSNNVPAGANSVFIGSEFPIGGKLSTDLKFPAASGLYDGSLISVPVISGGGITGFTTYTVDSSLSSGYSDINDVVSVPEPVISVAQGFFFQNATVNSLSWTQSL